MSKLKVFELYSGIGGMHFALKKSGLKAEVIKAIDINSTANKVYRLNFPETTLLEKNIQNLKEDDFNNCNVDMILMSPPCQPHTRNGLKKDMSDQRSESLLHILNLLPKLKTVKFILLENVKGFEISDIRNKLIELLNDSGYVYQEFLLSPIQFGIPNSRLRYYLLAKKKPLNFYFKVTNCILENLPEFNNETAQDNINLREGIIKSNSENSCHSIKTILDNTASNSVPEKLLIKYGTLFDVVTSESLKSCCFTKSYGHFVEGTGSVFSPKNSAFVSDTLKNLDECSNDSNIALELLKSLELRYFTPKEISRLMSFPDKLTFPSYFSDKQKYRLLGNSINVHVVASLINVLHGEHLLTCQDN